MRSITPNPRKRSFLLPPGCKDLIDLLHAATNKKKPVHSITGSPPDNVKHGGRTIGKVSDIERHVGLVFASSAPLFALYIQGGDPRRLIAVWRNETEVKTSVHVELGTEDETVMRQFFKQHGLPAPAESQMPPQFTAGLPVYQDFTISPVSADASTISGIVASWFREIVRLTEDSDLHFSTLEIADSEQA